MKKLLIVIFCLISINCQKKENHPLSISGKISNYSKEYLIIGRDTTGIGLKTSIDSIKLDQEGSFHFVPQRKFKSNPILILDTPETTRINLSKFIVDPIEFNFDLSWDDSLSISGNQAPFVQYQQDQQEYWKNIYEDFSNRHPVLSQSDNQKEEYHIIQDTITQLRIAFLEDYFEGLEIENQSEFIDYEKNSLIYSNLFYRMSGQKKEIIKKLSFYRESADSPSLSFSDQVDFSKKSLFTIYYYREFIIDFLMNDVRLHSSDGNISSYEFFLKEGLKRIDVWFKNPETNSLAKVIFINDLLSKAKIFKAQIDINEFRNIVKDLEKEPLVNNYLPILNEAIEELKLSMSKISPGNKAPEFNLVYKNDETFTSSDISEKIIIIDVWASWCQPCIAAFPKWNNLVLKNQNDNIEFLTISVDDTKEKWKRGMEKYSLEGSHLYAGEGGFKSVFAKDYNIKALPHYIAIDENGRILTVTSSFSDISKISLK